MSETRTVGTAILELLHREGIDTVFGLPGVHNLAFWSAQTPVRIVGVRHEQAAAYAADGYGRATGRVGVALTTTGPGSVNALAAFGEAAVSGAPVLVISSDVSTALRSSDGPRGILHEMGDQAAPFAAFDRPARTVGSAQQALAAVAEALAIAGTPPTGPAYVGIPSDILNAEWTGDLPTSTSPYPAAAAPAPSAAGVEALASLIKNSERVAIWAGGGVAQCGEAGESALRLLAERLGAPVVTTYAGRGVMAGHPLTIEASTHEPEVEAVLGDADLLLVVGSGFDAMHTKNWKMAMPRRRAAIALGSEVTRTVPWDVLIRADLVATLTSLQSRLDELDVNERPAWAPTGLREAVRARLRADERMVEPVAFVEAVESWPVDGVVVTDMCVAGYWTSSHARHDRPRHLLNPVGWGTLGYALPAAIGPAAAGMPTLAVCGDGGPMFALGELATFVQEKLPIALVIVDDGGYGMLRYDQQVFGHPERGVDLMTPDWRLLAASFGIDYVEVDSAGTVGLDGIVGGGSVGSVPDDVADGNGHPAGSVPDDVADGDAGEVTVTLTEALSAAAARSGPTMIVLRATFYPPASTSPRWFETATGPRETA